MKIELEDGTVLEQPSSRDVAAALDFLRTPACSWARLSRGDWSFLRARRDASQGYRLELGEGSPEERYRTVSQDLSLDEVKAAFRAFCAEEPGWKEELIWQPDFYAILTDPESPHHERLQKASRTLLMQVVQTQGELPRAVPLSRIEKLADGMARRVAGELAEEEGGRFETFRAQVRSDVRDAILSLLELSEAGDAESG